MNSLSMQGTSVEDIILEMPDYFFEDLYHALKELTKFSLEEILSWKKIKALLISYLKGENSNLVDILQFLWIEIYNFLKCYCKVLKKKYLSSDVNETFYWFRKSGQDFIIEKFKLLIFWDTWSVEQEISYKVWKVLFWNLL